MTGKTHRIIGLASGLSYLLASSQPEYSPATFSAVLIASYVASLVPDLDQPAADIWDLIPFGHALGETVDPFFKHRNISHSILGAIIFGYLLHLFLSAFPSYWGVNTETVLYSALVAYGSHLVADAITVEGVPIFYPVHRMFGIPPKPFEGVRIMTGKWFENLILFPLVDLWLLMTFILNWDKIKQLIFK